MVNLLTSILFVFVATQSPDKYYDYSFAEFLNLPSVNETIDLDKPDLRLLEAAVFHASNEVRSQKRKTVFDYNPVLHKAARFHADYLFERKSVGHRNKQEDKYETPYKRIVAFGGDDFNGAAENLAMITPMILGKDNMYFIKNGEPIDKAGNPLPVMSYAQLARKVVDGWMHSKGHRKNLMGEYTFLACGVSEIAYNQDGVAQINFVQNFGYK